VDYKWKDIGGKSMIISYDYGHLAGLDRGAEGILNEEVEIRRYAPYCVSYMMDGGNTLINCTPPQGIMTLQESLDYRVNTANESGSQLHLCFHVNAFERTSNPMGAELEVASATGSKIAIPVLAEICKLGFINRGIKNPDLYVTKNTKMTAILCEPFFCDSEADCKIYKPQALGEAIARGLLSCLGGMMNVQSILNSTQLINQSNDWIKRLQIELNLQYHAGLVVDGIAGIRTLSACIVLKQSSNGNLTKLLQEKLGIVIDGIFGNDTTISVKTFQKSNSLLQDGICGNDTWKKLI